MRRRLRGRLLSEFLVSLGLFFLAMTANLVILKSASQSSGLASASREALGLAREGLEMVIASPPPSGRLLRTEVFSSKSGAIEGFSFTRTLKVVVMPAPMEGLCRASVVVDWGRGRSVSLERYVTRP